MSIATPTPEPTSDAPEETNESGDNPWDFGSKGEFFGEGTPPSQNPVQAVSLSSDQLPVHLLSINRQDDC